MWDVQEQYSDEVEENKKQMHQEGDEKDLSHRKRGGRRIFLFVFQEVFFLFFFVGGEKSFVLKIKKK